MFKVFRVGEFEQRMHQFLTEEQKQRVEKIEDEISTKGFTGNVISFKFFREKRIDDKRIYFLVYDNLKAVLMISVSDKKSQQGTINKIKGFFPEYKKLAEKLVNSI